MADQFTTINLGRVQHPLKIENIIGKMIVSTGADPTAIAVAAAVRRDNAQGPLRSHQNLLNEKLPAVGKIKKAVDQYQRLAAGVTPFQVVDRQTLAVDDVL